MTRVVCWMLAALGALCGAGLWLGDQPLPFWGSRPRWSRQNKPIR